VQLMAPFTPFFCESLYQNLKKALPEGEPDSVHWCSLPEVSTSQVPPHPPFYIRILHQYPDQCKIFTALRGTDSRG